ncbi:HpcH/HpaI aldolase family protein [Microlunatus soli]|uniref:4-hydroxy-2-oxoheptanedioate aldolase n=1 Tax=Microlunatus soli TaxID=630515 RepID=A0A1H1ZUF9_9ACTN|nr:aldolase/citrate lyase family protein [Microlunatus soli]SDT37300.1 4-hydroxy-2-oxoheptanedioate aldolase [Microlunatus soli]
MRNPKEEMFRIADPKMILKARLSAGETPIGALVRMPSEDVIEMLGVAGFAFLIIDCEHGPADVVALRRHITVADLHGMPVLVRIGEGENALALRALDQGAQGIIAPHVDDAADAAALVRAVHYPPYGQRGFATYPRAGRFGTVPAEDHRRAARETTLVIAMLESPTAVDNTEAILNTPGIDGYLIGAADLAAASGPDDPPVPEAIAEIRRRAAQIGSIRTDLVGDARAARDARAAGAGLIVYNLTQALMGFFGELTDLDH